MRIRPWPIVILAAFHFCAPAFNVVYSAWLMHVGVNEYLHLLWSSGQWVGNAVFFLSMPAAGIAIYKTNRWSYPIFLFLMTSALATNFQTWREFPEYFNIYHLALTYAINLAVVTYFLVPQVREVYFNPKLRWWETKPRYDVSVASKIWSLDRENSGTMLNISEGGAYLETPMVLFRGSDVRIYFEIGTYQLNLPCKVVHARRAEPSGYGLEFLHTRESAAKLKELVRGIKASGMYERVGSVDVVEEFKSWFRSTLRTGKGLLPKSAASRGSSTSDKNSTDKAA